MAEITSKQAALIVLGKKAYQSQDAGRVRTLVMSLPAAYASLAIADTVASGLVIPAGSRLLGAKISFGTGTASQTVSIGIRDAKTKVAIDATAIANAIAAVTATTAPIDASNGTKIAAGVDYATTVDTEPYLTVAGAATPANQAMVVVIYYIGA